MKLRFKFNRRHNLYITLFTCAVGLWLMVTRFGVSPDELLSYAIICIVLLVALVGTAALFGFVLRLLRDRHE